jgi:vacuolar-type H+-ATPase subunit I/STV1
MIGGNVIDDDFRRFAVNTQLEGISKLVEGANWEKATNKVIVDNLIEKIEKLLDGKARHYIVADKKTSHRKIVIEYDHGSNLQ